MNTNEFIEEGILKHGNVYNYSLVEYKSRNEKIKIICPTHGILYIKPTTHLSGIGCTKCSGKYVYDTREWIEEAIRIHGMRYDYSITKYINKKTKVQVICKEHGMFEQNPRDHLRCKDGCPKCSKNYSCTTDEWIQKANKVHNELYDYSLVDYKGSNHKIKIICKKHGIYLQSPTTHITQKQGCPRCNNSKGELIIREWLLLNLFDFEEQKKFPGCRLKRELPFDFYLPTHNTCIEFDGQQHSFPFSFKSNASEEEKSNNLTYIKERDNIKTNFCMMNGIKLIRISYKNIFNINVILSNKLC